MPATSILARTSTAIVRCCELHRWSRLILTAAALGQICQSAQAGEAAFVGTWAPDVKNCALPQSSDRAPMRITPRGYDQHETHCKFGPLSGGGASWTTDAKCSVQGDTQKVLISMTVSGKTLKIKQGPGRAVKLQRCS